MTLQNGLAMRDRALLWADTAFIDPNTGELLCCDTKAFQSTTFPAVVTMTTIGGSPYLIPETVSQQALAYLSLGDFLAACEDAARHYVTHQPEIAAARLLVAGWCNETDSARLFVIGSDQWHPDATPFVAAEVDHYVTSGNRSAAYQIGLGIGFTPARMLTIADPQRAETIQPDKGGFPAYHGIGGNLVEYEVARSGVTSRVVREWGDRVGERINPARYLSADLG